MLPFFEMHIFQPTKRKLATFNYGRHFYLKQLALHRKHTIHQFMHSLGVKSTTIALLASCSVV